MESLFEHIIFDRKTQIIDQTQKKADEFAQQLAIKIIIAGRTPPPSIWWNPNITDKEFKKEELLSQLLLPHPQPNRGVFYSLHNQRTALEGKEEVETRGCGGTYESNQRYNLEHEPVLVSNVNNIEIGSALNAPEQDVSATPLQGKIAAMVSDVIAEPANVDSHASERGCYAEDRSTPVPKFNNNDVRYILASAPELAQNIIFPQGQNETRISSNFTARDQSLSRIQRSKSRQKALELRKTVEKADKIHQRNSNSSVVCYDGETLRSNASKQCHPHQGDESLGLTIYSGSLSHNYAEFDAVEECLSKEKETNPYCGRTTRSRSSRNVVTHENKYKLGNSLNIADLDDEKTIGSLNNYVEEVPKLVHISNASGQRVTRPTSGASGKSSPNFVNCQRECHSQNEPSSELILCCPDTYDIINQKEKTDSLIETEVILDGPAKVHAACSESTLDGAGPSVLEDFDSRPSSKSRMAVKPKILDFEEMGTSSLIGVIKLMVETEILDKSLVKRRESANPPEFLDKVTFSNSSERLFEKQSQGEEISNQISISRRHSYETCLEERVLDDEQVTESARDDRFLACDAVDSPSFDGGSFTSDEIRFLEQSPFQGRKLRSTEANTWPQLKRRKIEIQETKFFSDAISFRVKENHHMGGISNNRFVNSIGSKLKTILRFERSPSSHEENATQSDVNKRPDLEIQPKILTQETGLLSEMPIKQGEVGFGGKSQRKRFPLSNKDGECVSASSLSYGAEDFEISFDLNDRTANATSTVLDVCTQGSEKDELSRNGRALPEKRPYILKDGYHPSCSAASLEDHLGTSASDQTKVEFEGFIIDEEVSENRHTVGEAFDHLDLPTNNVERASLLEQLCRSAVMHTPVFRFSSTHNICRTPNVYQSVPNGVIEHLCPKSTLNSSGDGLKQLRASYSSVPISYTFNGQRLKIPPTSPVSELWGRMSSQSLSSEKKPSSNPELTCFPIEEDPSISEEEEDKEEVEVSTQEDICSASIDFDSKRKPLADVAQANVNPSPFVSAAKILEDKCSLASVNTEVNCSGTHGRVKKKLAKGHSSKRIGEVKKRLTLSTKTSSMGIATESLNNRFSKANLTRKTSLRNGGHNASGRESKHNNIISNISSFVPLVQQKQAAALVTGKRDVKVKALETAQAAKRLEEKKDNERKLKKEAFKLERARMEQENLRQADLKRRKKEEDLKKKEADVAARKRLRKEEEKKEKERKRRRFEGKQQQREQEERLRALKAKKVLTAAAIDTKLNTVTGTTDALRKSQKVKVDIDKENETIVKKQVTELVASTSLDDDVRKAVLEGLEAFGDCSVSTEVTDTRREKSYEISPYQSSDNEEEDDEEDEIPSRKSIPTWASKTSLAQFVSSQQNVDPGIVFALKSFRSVDEVSGHEVHKKK